MGDSPLTIAQAIKICDLLRGQGTTTYYRLIEEAHKLDLWESLADPLYMRNVQVTTIEDQLFSKSSHKSLMDFCLGVGAVLQYLKMESGRVCGTERLRGGFIGVQKREPG